MGLSHSSLNLFTGSPLDSTSSFNSDLLRSVSCVSASCIVKPFLCTKQKTSIKEPELPLNNSLTEDTADYTEFYDDCYYYDERIIGYKMIYGDLDGLYDITEEDTEDLAGEMSNHFTDYSDDSSIVGSDN
jgi:hypothetical protein